MCNNKHTIQSKGPSFKWVKQKTNKGKNMKKLVLLVVSLFAAFSAVRAADVANVSLEAGYNNAYVVNGVAYAQDLPYASIGALKSLKYADVYVGGTLLADGNQDQSHWLVGAGKNLYTWNQFTARLDGNVIRHQTATSGLDNSTEAGVKLAIQNPWITPYVRGAFNFELHQNAYFVGAERAQKLPFGFVLTPSVEWGRSTDYEALNAKASLTRPVTFAWGSVTPFAEVGWFHNGTYDATAKAFALTRFDNDVVYSAGLKLSF